MFKQNFSNHFVVICLLLVVALSGCSAKALKKPVDFSKNTNVIAEIDVSDSKISIIQNNIRTNSEQITVTNRTAEHSIIVYLFQNDETEAIMSFELKQNEKKKFTNLTSAHTYSIGASINDLNKKTTIVCEITD